MRVLALVLRYVPGTCAGAETMLHGMLRALAARGYHVDVSISDLDHRCDPYVIDGVNVWPYVDKKDVFVFLRQGVDVVVSHLENAPRAAALGEWNGVPVVIVNHNTFLPSKQVLIAPQGRVALAVVNSQWVANDLHDWVARQRRLRHVPRVTVYRPTVDPAEHATTPGDRVTLVNMRVEEKGPGDVKVMGKGGVLFRRLAECMPDTLFLGVTGAYGTQQDMTGLANVDVLPHLPYGEMREKVWARTRILLVPSSYESWGRVASEAMCSGIPVVAHPTPGLLENLGDAGIFVDRDDTDAWVKAIRDLTDPDTYEAASKLSLIRAQEQQQMHLADEANWCDVIEDLGR